jgi:uncharacterized protein (TIGR03435 family)
MKLLTAFLLSAICAAAQPALDLEFEVATIKPADPDSTSSGVDADTGLLRIQNQSLHSLVRIAYNVNDRQVAGGPKWVESDRFDVNGKANGPASGPELLLMLQTLLADQFSLTFHRETRTVTGYALAPAKGGLKMEVAKGDGASTSGRRGTIEAKGGTMKVLAERLTRLLQAPVEDATGTTGGFNFTLKWSPEETGSQRPPGSDASSNNALPESSGPTIFTALQEQLGLRLESRKVSMEVLVIDNAEKPKEN